MMGTRSTLFLRSLGFRCHGPIRGRGYSPDAAFVFEATWPKLVVKCDMTAKCIRDHTYLDDLYSTRSFFPNVAVRGIESYLSNQRSL